MINIYAVSYMTATRADQNSINRVVRSQKPARTPIWKPRGSWLRRGVIANSGQTHQSTTSPRQS